MCPCDIVQNQDAIDCLCFIPGWQVSRWQAEMVSQENEKSQNHVIVFLVTLSWVLCDILEIAQVWRGGRAQLYQEWSGCRLEDALKRHSLLRKKWTKA